MANGPENSYMMKVLKSFMERQNVGCLVIMSEEPEHARYNYSEWIKAVPAYIEKIEPDLEYSDQVSFDDMEVFIVTKTSDIPRKLEIRDLYGITKSDVKFLLGGNVLVYRYGVLAFVENFEGGFIGHE